MAGKPYRADLRPRAPRRPSASPAGRSTPARVLAIGDGIATDVKGANAAGAGPACSSPPASMRARPRTGADGSTGRASARCCGAPRPTRATPCASSSGDEAPGRPRGHDASGACNDWRGLAPGDRGASPRFGNFDGVHRGHQQVIAAAKAAAERLGAPLGVISFEPHPRRWFQPAGRAVPRDEPGPAGARAGRARRGRLLRPALRRGAGGDVGAGLRPPRAARGPGGAPRGGGLRRHLRQGPHGLGRVAARRSGAPWVSASPSSSG